MAVCTRVYYKETLVPVIMQGREGVPVLNNMLDAAMPKLEMVDAVDMSTYALATLKEYLAIWKHFKRSCGLPLACCIRTLLFHYVL